MGLASFNRARRLAAEKNEKEKSSAPEAPPVELTREQELLKITVAELKPIAEGLGIEVKGMKKPELVAAIVETEKAASEQVDPDSGKDPADPKTGEPDGE